MPRAPLAALLAVMAWPGGSAAARDAKPVEAIDGLVRIVGAQAGIVLYCRNHSVIDDVVSEGLSRTVRRSLDAALGRRRAGAVIAEEARPVSGEIAAVGAEQWCADQRDILNTEGVRIFVD
jgi:hypothetical protein